MLFLVWEERYFSCVLSFHPQVRSTKFGAAEALGRDRLQIGFELDGKGEGDIFPAQN